MQLNTEDGDADAWWWSSSLSGFEVVVVVVAEGVVRLRVGGRMFCCPISSVSPWRVVVLDGRLGVPLHL